jgi:threonine aldolase
MIDLRSDTVTLPTPAMWKAMAEAEVGDDVYGEDPTINRLQAMSAERLGKEAAIFVPSGTMGNLASILAHCGRGDEIILGDKSHVFLNEQGGTAVLGGIVPHTVPNQPDGTLKLDDVAHAIRGDNIHYPRSRLVCLENTHNACNGSPLSAGYVSDVADLAHQHNLKLHIDGARIFNAAVALHVPVDQLVKDADSVTFCLSKGLCAPVGSVICGDATYIKNVIRTRKILGGGMRQVGVLAAAGIVALEQMTERLVEDHERAAALQKSFDAVPWINAGPAYTNIFYFTLSEDAPITGSELALQLKDKGILLPNRGPNNFRVVTHYWFNDDALTIVQAAIKAIASVYG